MKITLLIVALLLAFSSIAQVAPDKYFIEFLDKTGTPFNINQPEAFLSQRSIDRRIAQGIVISEEDLPVNPEYLNTVKNIGVTLLNSSKWLNGVTIYTTDPSAVAAITALPFVKNMFKISVVPGAIDPIMPDKFKLENEISVTGVQNNKNTNVGYDYGNSFNQIHMLNGEILHNAGYRGQGKLIAVLDAGFTNADILPAFDSMRAEGRLVGAKDFVNKGGNVYQVPSNHGTMVLSTMGGNIPGQIIGTAPKAAYWLLRSEDAETEYIIEEYNWVSAAEFADSVGADIINSSLGYTGFDEPTYSHSCADMDGNTTPVTRGANIAASKGIAVINSAGNSGGSGWTCVGAPSDGDLVVAIGAVDEFGFYASFSSTGVDTNGRVKPNVSAQGQSVWVAGGEGSITQSSGTSFSSPIIAGMVACLWQAHPTRTREEIVNSMQVSSSQYSNPDSLLGYGIPDFSGANILLSSPEKETLLYGKIYPVPFRTQFTIEFYSNISALSTKVVLTDITGRTAGEWHSKLVKGHNKLTFSPAGIASGVYILTLSDKSFRVVKE